MLWKSWRWKLADRVVRNFREWILRNNSKNKSSKVHQISQNLCFEYFPNDVELVMLLLLLLFNPLLLDKSKQDYYFAQCLLIISRPIDRWALRLFLLGPPRPHPSLEQTRTRCKSPSICFECSSLCGIQFECDSPIDRFVSVQIRCHICLQLKLYYNARTFWDYGQSDSFRNLQCYCQIDNNFCTDVCIGVVADTDVYNCGVLWGCRGVQHDTKTNKWGKKRGGK